MENNNITLIGNTKHYVHYDWINVNIDQYL